MINTKIQHYVNAAITEIKGLAILSMLLLSLFANHASATSSPDFWLAKRGDQKIWLLGSIHVGRSDMYPLPTSIMDCWQQAETLIVETNLDQTDMSSQQKLLNYAMLPDNVSLRQQMSESLYQKTEQTAARYQLQIALLDKFRPWFVAITLQQQAIQQAGYQASLGIDQYFVGLAQTKHKSVVMKYLETPEQQFAYLSKLGDVESDFLESTLVQIDRVNDELPHLIEAWESGDKNKIQALLNDSDTSPNLQAYLEQNLIKERNQNWMPQIENLTSQNNFMVVGAMHLYGDNGLLTMLKQHGYTLTNISTQ